MSSCHSARWLLFVIVLAGCSNNAPHGRPAIQVAQAPNANPPAPDGPAIPAQRKIIYTSQIEVIASDLDAAQKKLAALINNVEDAGGYLARQEIVGKAGFHRQSSWTVRVPLSQYDGFVTEVEKLGELQRNSREAQDVTEAYADLEARLHNKQSSEARLLNHLEKSAELKDTLEVERELSRVRGEVEQLQGQLNLLKNKTDLATVSVTLHERENYVPPTAPDFSTLVQRTFQSSLQGLLKAGQILVLMVVAVIPWLTIALIFLIPVALIRQATRQRQA